VPWTNAGRRKAAKKRKGRHLSAKTRAKIAAKRRGHHLKASTRKKISQRLKGRKHPHKGHKMSSVTRKKISARLKGRHHKGHKPSAATRAKLSKALKGKKHPHKGSHVKHKFHHRKVTHRTKRRNNVRPAMYKRLVRIGRRHHRFQKFGRGHVHGRSNLQIVQKAAGHRIVPKKMKISNQTVLQNKLGRKIMPALHGRTNRRLVLGSLNKRRRRFGG
jgi:hypothetical protein